MKPIKTLLLLLLCFCGIIGVVSADNGSGTSSNSHYDISENHSERKTKATSDHLRMLRAETALHILDILRGNRYRCKLAGGGNFQLFTKSGKATSTKSDKATKRPRVAIL